MDFSINSSNGQITSNASLNYSTESSHIFDVLYARGGVTFTETLTITVADPTQASSVTNITAEETDALTMPSTNFSSTASFVSSNPGGTFSLTGADAGSFNISNSGEVTSSQVSPELAQLILTIITIPTILMLFTLLVG